MSGFTRLALFLLTSGLLISAAFALYRLRFRKEYTLKGRLSVLSILLELGLLTGHAYQSYLFLPVVFPALPRLPTSPLRLGAGFCLILMGGLTMIFAVLWLGSQKTFGRECYELKRSGIYKWIRNPQITGYGVVLVGFAVLWPSLYALGWVFLYGAITHLSVRTEEEHLLRLFGEDYECYCSETPRYVPLPWRLRR